MNQEKPFSKGDEEFVDDSTNLFPLTVIIAFLVVFVTIVILRWAKNRREASRGQCLLLCGLSNAGKTILFMRLTMNFVKRTITSAATNRGTMSLTHSSADRPSKEVEVIDIPGNLRIRQREFNSNKAFAKAMIFLIDSTTIQQDSKDVADYLYDILREKAFRQQRLPLLIFCNKQDANNGNESSATIRRLLETELTMKRRTRASSVAVHQGKNEGNEDIGRPDKDTFEFSDVKDIQIDFAEGSALGIERKAFAGQYDDDEGNETIDSAGDETDADSGTDLDKLYQWMRKIWMK